jgi:iron complex outermembrane receptor protein
MPHRENRGVKFMTCRLRKSLLFLLIMGGPALGADQTPTGNSVSSNGAESTTLGEVIVTGTRVQGLKAEDSLAPVQIIGSDALNKVGEFDLSEGLLQTVPSFNFGAGASNGDLGALFSYARLRGLSPNDTLVLIDGKRRHGTANMVVDGGQYQGATGADLSLIPLAAIDHVEVLTDGAAAQYGTDAIAGVINIILKHDDHGGLLTATGGQYYSHEGNTGDATVNFGLAPIENSFLNITAEVKIHGHSDTIGPDPLIINHDGYDNVGQFPQVVNVPGYPYVQGGAGDPLYRLALLTYNSGFNLNDALELYSFGTFGYRNAQAYQNYRPPNVIPQVWPNGFNPIEAIVEYDFAETGGVKGKVAGWNYDLSLTYGSDNDQVNVDTSANPDLYQTYGFTPTDFHVGGFVATQLTTNLDLSHEFDVGLAAPLNLAFGAEARHETYEVEVGDPASRFEGGSASYPGFTLTDQGEHTRSNEAGYVDVALTPIENLKLDGAGRFEHYSDFGDTTTGKLTARYDFSPEIALRGTVSNGFRAPTLAEEHYSATNVGPGIAFVQLPPNSVGASLIGVDGLKPEKSTNYSLGLVLHPLPNMTATIDAYQISIKDRIVGSGNVFGAGDPTGVNSPNVIAAIEANGDVVNPNNFFTGINVFNNGVDTRTRGVDFVLTRPDDFGDFGRVDWSLSGSYDSTVVTQVLAPPAQIAPQALLNETALSFLSTASPNYRIIVGALWQKSQWSLNLKELIYGQSSEEILGDDGKYYSVKAYAQPITNISLSYAPIPHVKLTIGADNAFNVFPKQINPALLKTYYAANDGAGAYSYPYFTPYGTNGGYYYGRVTVNW